jgi:hypothetical protein
MAKIDQMSDREMEKMRRKAERARAKAQLMEIRQDKERWVKGLQEMPVSMLLQQTASLALPDTKKEALVEGGLILGTAAVTYVATAALTTALAGAGIAIGSMAAYNVWRKNRGELQEIADRVLTFNKELPENKE